MTRRAIILPGVLLVVSIAAIVGVAALARTDAHQDLAAASIASMQSRSLAWSGVLAVQSQLFANREAILAGAEPVVQPNWSTSVSGGIGVVRLLPFRSEDSESAVFVEYESAKLDVNSVSEESLAKIDGLGPEIAAAILAARSGGFQCAEAIATVEGVTDEVLFGPMRETENPGARRGVLQSLTTFAFDPNTSFGAGQEGASNAGRLRVPVSTPWSESFAKLVTESCGEGVAQSVSQIVGGKISVRSESDLLRALKSKGVPASSWGSVLDCISVSDDLFRIGKTDINHADPSVLALLPGFDEDVATRIVSTRANLPAQKRLDPTWPLLEGVVDEDRFLQVIDFISTRSAQFRVRVEAGVRSENSDFDSSQSDAERLDRSVILEAVIDIAGDVPRVAYLRDITHMQSARRLAREVRLREVERDDTESTPDAMQAPLSGATIEVGESNSEKPADEADELKPAAKDTEENIEQNPIEAESSSPAKLKDRRIGRWKNPARSG